MKDYISQLNVDPEGEIPYDLCQYVMDITYEDPVGGLFPHTFWYRLCTGQIKTPFSRNEYLANEPILSTIKGLGLDTDKFMILMIFIYDWAEEQFTHCIDVQSHSYGIMLKKLLEQIGDGKDLSITFRCGKRNITVPPLIKRSIVKSLHESMKSIREKQQEYLVIYKLGEYKESFPVPSYKIYFATEKYRFAFSLMKRLGIITKPRKDRNSTVSYNIMLLISRIIYLYRFTKNENFLVSDEPLKGIMKSYKGRVPATISSVYHGWWG